MARNNITVSIGANTRQLVQGVNSATTQVSTGLGRIRSRITGSLSSAFSGNALRTVAVGAGAAAGGFFISSLNTAMEQGKVTSRLAAQLGATPKVAQQLGDVAGKLYSKGITEDFQGAAEAIKATMQSGLLPPGATTKQIQEISTKVQDLAGTFDQDLGGVTNAVSQMLRTGLAKNANEAFDIITKGFQSGANKADDLLDTFNEYGTQFRKLGIDGPHALGLIQQGLQGGARDADLVADSLKEFSIRAVDGSKTTAQGFKLIGLNAKTMAEQIGKGGKGASDALQLTLDKLRGIKDPVKQSQAAVALFGTQAEDLGKALFNLDPSKATQTIGNVGGAAKKLGDTLRDNATSRIENFKRTLSQTFVTYLGDKVLPKLTAFGDFVSKHMEVFKPLGAVIGALAGAFLIVAAATWAWNAALAANPIGLIVLAIAGLAAGLYYAYQKSSDFRDIVDATWTFIKQTVGPVMDSAKQAVMAGLQFISDLWAQHGAAIMAAVTQIFEGIKTVISGAMQYIRGVIQIFTGLISGDWGKVWTGIQNVFGGIWKVITGLFQVEIGIIRTNMTVFLAFVSGIWNSIWGGISGFFKSIWNGIKSFGSTALTGLRAAISGGLGLIKSAWNGAWSAVTSFFSTQMGNFKKAASNALSTVVGYFTGLKGKITTALAAAGTWLFTVGQNIVKGMINGIKSMTSEAINAAKGVASSAVSGAKHLLGIHSPSTVFKEIGQFVVKGLVIGLGDNRPVSVAMGKLSNTVTDSFSPQLAIAGGGTSAAAVGARTNTYNITVNALDPKTAGPLVVQAIKDYERANGSGWSR